MNKLVALASAPFVLLLAGPALAVPLPLASHRAAYEVTLTDPAASPPPSARVPVGAAGLMTYEFRGSACEGYASSFREATELQRNEGEAVTIKTNAALFEEAGGKAMRFENETLGPNAPPAVAGAAVREAGDDVHVALTKPKTTSLDIGRGVMFPTQQVEAMIAAGRTGTRLVQARVYDGSDTGAKVYATLAVVGKAASGPGADAAAAPVLAGVRRWPVVVSYFDEAKRDGPPEYVQNYDLYENGVSGTMTIDYGQFALRARLAKLELLPSPRCAK